MLLISFLSFFGQSAIPTVRYFSTVQIENVYTKNRLTVTTDPDSQTFEPAWIYASRPPFEDGWTWTVVPSHSPMELARTPVQCGDNISLSNPVAKLFVGTRITPIGVQVVPSVHSRGESDEWTVICRNPPHWAREQQIQLRNVLHGCFLSTSLEDRPKEGSPRFGVTCGPLTADAVWRSAEGVYFGDARGTESSFDDNL
jgi:hypothetical protein